MAVSDFSKTQIHDNIDFLFELLNMLELYDSKYSFVNVEKMNIKFDIYCDYVVKHINELKSLKDKVYFDKINGEKNILK